jgi:histidinol-phosphate/aromatic aminotransferase/cobyric acid decarboxylase-like protein
MFAKRFQHLGKIERKRIVMPDNTRMRLNRLERPQPWEEELQCRIVETFRPDQLQQYPNYQPFYERLAEFAGCGADDIVVGAGIEEFIRNLFMLCIEPGDKVAYLWPTCAMFDVYARVFQAEPVHIKPEPSTFLTAEGFISQLPDDLKLLILAQPGQPVENMFSRIDIMRIADACRDRDAVLALDEAYYGFGAYTEASKPRFHPNVVTLRTFSKAFGAASIRLGYAIGGGELIHALNAVRQSGEVSAFSMHAATVLMDHHESHVKPAIRDICDGRDWLRDMVREELGLKAWGHQANHVLIEMPNAVEVANRLAGKGVLVKAGFPAPIDSHMLVTCGDRDLMTTFCAELMAAL